MSDTPASGPESSALDTVQAAAEFAKLLDPQLAAETQPEQPAEQPKEQPKAEGDKPVEETLAQEEQPAEEVQKITVKIDGKDVELTPEQIAEAYKGNLRQADYTKKTMEVAEQRKAAEAEASKAREERQKYAEGLNQAQALLQAQLQEQGQIDWQKLLVDNPVEYMRQDRIARERQAQLQYIQQEQQQLKAKFQEERDAQQRTFLQQQQEDLLAKLPEWKDEAKAKEGRAQLVEWLKTNEYPKELLAIVDRSSHLIVTARKAMLYDQMMAKAQTAAKKVSNLPAKVERPGGGDTNPLDGRTSAMKQLQRSGKVEDAARVFAQFL